MKTEIIKEAHGLMMEDEKYVLTGEHRMSPVFACYHIFEPASHIERCMEDAVFSSMRLKGMIQLWLLQICLETLSICIHLKMGMEKFVARFWLMF